MYCLQLRVGQDSESDEDPLESKAKTTNSDSLSDSLPVDPFERHSDQTPDPVQPESSDEVVATLPRSFPRQQVQSNIEHYLITRVAPLCN